MRWRPSGDVGDTRAVRTPAVVDAAERIAARGGRVAVLPPWVAQDGSLTSWRDVARSGGVARRELAATVVRDGPLVELDGSEFRLSGVGDLDLDAGWFERVSAAALGLQDHTPTTWCAWNVPRPLHDGAAGSVDVPLSSGPWRACVVPGDWSGLRGTLGDPTGFLLVGGDDTVLVRSPHHAHVEFITPSAAVRARLERGSLFTDAVPMDGSPPPLDELAAVRVAAELW